MHSEELDLLHRLLKAMELLTDFLEKHPVTYASAIRAYNAILFGVIPRITCDCPACGEEITITPNVPVGGFDDALDVVEKAIEDLEWELELENTPDLDGPTYEI